LWKYGRKIDFASNLVKTKLSVSSLDGV
jgi:hypothetical protein